MAEYLKIVKENILCDKYIDLCVKGSFDTLKLLSVTSSQTKVQGLCKVCLHGHFELLKELITKDPTYSDMNNMYIIEEVIKGQHIDIVKYILEISRYKYPRHNYADLLNFSIYYAYKSGNTDIIKSIQDHINLININLIDKGSDPITIHYMHALEGALRGNHTELVFEVISKYNVSVCGGLYYSYLNNNKDLIEYFSKQQPNSSNIQALKGACTGGHVELVKQLIDLCPNNLDYALERVCFSSGPNCCEIAEILISRGANNLNSALHDACYKDNYDLVKLLLNHGARDIDNRCMSQVHNVDIMKLLKDHGGDPTKTYILPRMKYLTDVMSKKHQTWIINEIFGTYLHLNFILINK
jgi:ankyrin repeat protein